MYIFKLDQTQNQLFFEGWQHFYNQVVNQVNYNSKLEEKINNIIIEQEYTFYRVENLEQDIKDLRTEIEKVTSTGNTVIHILTDLIITTKNLLQEIRRNNSRSRLYTTRTTNNLRSKFTTVTERRRLETRN